MGKVKVVDKGWLKIKKNTNKLDGVKIKAGLFGSGQPDTNLAYRGHIQEYGRDIAVTEKMRGFLHTIGIHLSPNTTHISIPSRPFMRNAHDANAKKALQKIVEKYKKLQDNKLSSNAMIGEIGSMMVDNIKKSIQSGNYKPNHPATIRGKTGSRPLIDSGDMLRGVKYKVEK